MHNSALYIAGRGYVEAALRLLASRSHPQDRETLTEEEWVRANPTTFVRQTRYVYSWSKLFQMHAADLHSLPEYESFLDILDRDIIIRPQLDTPVGSPYSSRQIEKNNLMDELAHAVASAAGNLQFDENAYNQEYTAMENALYDPFIDCVWIAPLLYLNLKPSPVEMDSGILLDTLTDQEMALCIKTGIIRSQFGDAPVVSAQWNCGIRVQFRLPKVVGEAPSPPPVERHAETVSGIASALHLFKRGAIVAPGYLTYTKNWLTRGSISWTMLQPADPSLSAASKYDLLNSESEDFCRLWKSLRTPNVQNEKALGNALRRFGYTAERRHPEDRLIDLIIAAESLFLTDDRPEFRGEQQYRISIRAALFIEIQGRTRRQIYDVMRFAYRTRNTVVHGGTPRPVTIPGSPPMELGEFADNVEEHMRSALKKAVIMAERGEKVDWEVLTLPES